VAPGCPTAPLLHAGRRSARIYLSQNHHFGDCAGSIQMTEIRGYHAHVYYDPATKPLATKLRQTIIDTFTVEPGGFSDAPAGPHPISQFNVIFKVEEFRNVVPWLMLNREGLDVLVHPLTESSYDDHSKNAIWLGTPVPMKLDVLRPTYRAELLPKDLAHTA
jgi:DOPA 4,5-dioxygenase